MNRNDYRKRITAGLVFLLMIFLSAVIQVSAAPKEAEETITVGVPTDRCPMIYEDGDEIVGIGVDLLRSAIEEIGCKAEFVAIKEPSLKDALDNRNYDLLMPFGSPISSASGRETVISESLMQTPFTLVTTRSHKLPALNKLHLGMLRSQAAVSETIQQLYPGVEITLFETMPECVRELRADNVDALLQNSYVWSYVLQKPSYAKLKVQPSAMFSMDFRAGAQDTEEGRELIKRLNKGIVKIKDTERQAVILDYTSRRLYQYDWTDYLYEYGIILAIFLIITVVEIYTSRRLMKARRLSEEASKAKTMFLANMSHEIRTPINSIMGTGELVARRTRDPKLQQYAHTIYSSANSLLCLVNDILDYSRMEAGKLTLRQNPYHLSRLVTEVNMMIRERADAKGLKYDAVVNTQIPDELIGDENRLKQVMINLLTNGVKYTHSGSVSLIIDFAEAGEGAVDLIVTVKDTGIGLKQEEIERLFKAFERLDEDKNRSIEGTGLGMSIVKQILDAMESELSIQSEYGVGSEFSFRARQQVAAWNPIGDYECSAEQIATRQCAYVPSFTAPDVRILYVDDTEMNLAVLDGLLEQTKVRLDTAHSGKQALEFTAKKRYDILLIDHRMPEMDGVQLLHHIKTDPGDLNANTASIALTANVVEGEREICLEAGFDDFLEKPVSGSRLEEMLIKYLPKEKIRITDAADGADGFGGSVQDADAARSDELLRLQDEGYIDIDVGIEYAGSEALYLTTLVFFRDSVERKADEIEAYYASENIKDYTTKVHGLKSSAKIIGAGDLSEQAKNLELAGQRGDLDYIREHNDRLLQDYRRYRELLAKL